MWNGVFFSKFRNCLNSNLVFISQVPAKDRVMAPDSLFFYKLHIKEKAIAINENVKKPFNDYLNTDHKN